MTGHPVTVGRSETMSKSKKNVVDPGAIIDSYGADTARLFMLSDSPPERDLEWTDAGVDGAWRYLKTVFGGWLSRNCKSDPHKRQCRHPSSENAEEDASNHASRQSCRCITNAFDRFHFNGAVAKVRELSNAIEEFLDGAGQDAGRQVVLREAIEALTQLIGPMLPHIAEEMWAQLGYKNTLCDTPWPKADPDLLVEDSVTIAVQVNGKLRATITLPATRYVAERCARGGSAGQ